MKKLYLVVILFCLSVYASNAQQDYFQYFDGADTSSLNSLILKFDTSASNVWQVGRPQKIIFDSASTFPNALITDTINSYPINNTSSFTFTVFPWINWGLWAVQWRQKLDMDLHHDGGIIEYSGDSGNTWHNIINDPHIFYFYGVNWGNIDTLLTGEYALSGTDSSWRDVWLCVDLSWMSTIDSLHFRFTFKSDSIDNNKEGWMIDNMYSHITIMHPVKEVDKKDYMNVFPNPTKDIVNIEIQKVHDFHIIESMELVSSDGKIMNQWKNIPVKFWFDTSKYADGIYFLKVKTNIKSETIPIIVKKN